MKVKLYREKIARGKLDSLIKIDTQIDGNKFSESGSYVDTYVLTTILGKKTISISTETGSVTNINIFAKIGGEFTTRVEYSSNACISVKTDASIIRFLTKSTGSEASISTRSHRLGYKYISNSALGSINTTISQSLFKFTEDSITSNIYTIAQGIYEIPLLEYLYPMFIDVHIRPGYPVIGENERVIYKIKEPETPKPEPSKRRRIIGIIRIKEPEIPKLEPSKRRRTVGIIR